MLAVRFVLVWSLLVFTGAALRSHAEEAGTTPPAPVTEPQDPETDSDAPAIKAERITALATKYAVTEEAVTAMRTSGMGWGEMENALALAQTISADPANALTMTAALNAVLAARKEGVGFGEIAHKYGLKMGDIVSKIHKSGKAADDVGVRAEKPESPEKPEKPEKPERPGKPDKTGRPDKPEKPGKPDKPDRGD